MTNETLARGTAPIEPYRWPPLTGTESQIEWAERIRHKVANEFDRVANAFRAVAVHQTTLEQMDTDAVIAVLEDKRTEVMARREAGYFIHDWQELHDQVRQMIAADPRYQAVKMRRLVMKEARA